MLTRRDALKTVLAGVGTAAAVRINPEFFVNSAYAQAGKPMRFLAAEALTGNCGIIVPQAVRDLVFFARSFEHGGHCLVPLARGEARAAPATAAYSSPLSAAPSGTQI